MREVSETFLRCVKQKIGEENVVIELNALKVCFYYYSLLLECFFFGMMSSGSCCNFGRSLDF